MNLYKYLKDLDKLNQHFAVGDTQHKEAMK
jgi:hypothetical protein